MESFEAYLAEKNNLNGPSVELSLRVEEKRYSVVKSKKYLHMNDLNKAIKVKSNVLWPALRL